MTAGTTDLTAFSIPADQFRRGVMIFNNDPTVTVYLSTSPTAATGQSTGHPILAQTTFIDQMSGSGWYLYAASSTVNCRITPVLTP